MRLAACLLVSIAACAAGDPVSAAQGVLSRLLGAEYVAAVEFEVIPADPATGNDVFVISPPTAGGRVHIAGNTGVSLSSGLHHYLKYYNNASISWGYGGSGNQLATVPAASALPVPTATERVASPVKYRYYQNVCTVGYSMAWWNATRWQEEIDRMALWGINLPLGFIGQEWVWLQTYTALGVPAANLTDEWMSGPAFLPWFRMGNMQRWGGPLRMSWITQKRDLQITILGYMRDLGMKPVLPGFAGHIPGAIVTMFPNASVTQSADWNGFNKTYGFDWLLQPTDPLYNTIATTFYSTLIKEYGTDHFYNMDTFNEMDPSSSDPTYLKQSNAAIYNAMSAVDPQGVYVMQGWLFVNSPGFWKPAAVQAYLSGVPDDNMLILDLFTESTPTWNRFNSFYGKPWVWNMLLIFGGRRGIYGTLPTLASSIIDDQVNTTMVGIGATPEAIEMTPSSFDLLWDMGWRSAKPNVNTWIANYTTRRYGNASATHLTDAWVNNLLPGTMSLSNSYGTTNAFCWLEQSPAIGPRTDHDGTDPQATLAALRLFLQAAAAGEVDTSLGPYQYDLVDLARQVVCNVAMDVQNLMGVEYQRFQFSGVNTSASVIPVYGALLNMINDLDALLATNVNFLLGHWLNEARAWAQSGDDADWLEFNARNQITLWGPNGEISDYAAKNGWSGLVKEYYGGRWRIHHDYVVNSVITGQQVNWDAYNTDLTAFQWSWNTLTNGTNYPTTPTGDSLAAATAILNKYAGGNAAGYSVLANQDVEGVQVDIMKAYHNDPAVLQNLCDLDPACLGFNSNGYLKNVTSPIVASSGTTLYLKKQAQARPHE